MLDLSNLFDYDLWATRRWLLTLGSLRNLGRAHEILEHMLFAQRIWAERLGVEIPSLGDVSLDATFVQIHSIWKGLVEERDLDEHVDYENLAGEPFSNTVGEIAQHVINHGTYHRGQLRGLAEAEGFEAFPDTDLIIFLRD